MSFGQAISSVFKNYANFNGRARRSEFWFFALFNLIIYLAASVINYLIAGSSDTTSIIGIIYLLYSLATILPALAVSWRRLHDIGKSGAYILFILIPLVGWIFLLAWFVKDSDMGENRFGPNPKGQYPEY
jgi:uncharacterized membrane protein YhaH (DUF805 family)